MDPTGKIAKPHKTFVTVKLYRNYVCNHAYIQIYSRTHIYKYTPCQKMLLTTLLLDWGGGIEDFVPALPLQKIMWFSAAHFSNVHGGPAPCGNRSPLPPLES